jgi:hypothetical protein
MNETVMNQFILFYKLNKKSERREDDRLPHFLNQILLVFSNNKICGGSLEWHLGSRDTQSCASTTAHPLWLVNKNPTTFLI